MVLKSEITATKPFFNLPVCFNNPDAVKYQIMLEPADKDWRPVTERTVETYSSLGREI